MMAYDSRSTPEPRPLGDETVAALREAVLLVWSDPENGESSLQAAIAGMVDEARQRALRAEDVIVAFKDLLSRLPELAAPERRMEAARFRERLITLSIKAYYAP